MPFSVPPPLYLGKTVSVIGDEFKFGNSSATTTQTPINNYEITNKMYVDDKVNQQKIRIDAISSAIEIDVDKLAKLKEWLDSLDIEDLTNTLITLGIEINTLKSDLSQEIVDRESAIQSVIDMMTAEYEARITADGLINTNLDGLTARFDAYVLSNNTRTTNIETSVLNEATTRALEDNNIKQIIDNLKTTTENNILLAKTEAMNYTTELNATESLARSNADIEINATLLAVSGKLDIEIADREAAVNNLQSQIDLLDTVVSLELFNNEVTNRINGDIALDTKITTEKNTREAEVSTLRDRIATEENARSSEDIVLKKKIDDEISDRSTGYTDLGNRITAEENARALADQSLGNRVTNEELARVQAFSTLRDNLATETDTRIAEDTILRNRIATEEVAREAKDTLLQNKIEDEIIARDAKDTLLQNKIEAEIIARDEKDTLLQNKIEDEIIVRDAKDTLLQKNIEDEAIIRETTFNTLNSQLQNFTSLITDEASIRSEGITSLQTGLADEITIRTNADNTLQTAIETEVTNRTNKDADLEAQIIELKALLTKMKTDNKIVIDNYYNKINDLYLTFWHQSMDYSSGVDANYQMTFQYGPGAI